MVFRFQVLLYYFIVMFLKLKRTPRTSINHESQAYTKDKCILTILEKIVSLFIFPAQILSFILGYPGVIPLAHPWVSEDALALFLFVHGFVCYDKDTLSNCYSFMDAPGKNMLRSSTNELESTLTACNLLLAMLCYHFTTDCNYLTKNLFIRFITRK